MLKFESNNQRGSMITAAATGGLVVKKNFPPGQGNPLEALRGLDFFTKLSSLLPEAVCDDGITVFLIDIVEM